MIHGGFDYGERNNGRVFVLDFAVAYELLVVNSYFNKKEDHFLTFKSGSIKTQIDYFLIMANNRRLFKDCKVIPSEYLVLGIGSVSYTHLTLPTKRIV